MHLYTARTLVVGLLISGMGGCIGDKGRGIIIPDKTTPFVCESGAQSVKKGALSSYNAFVIDNASDSFFFISVLDELLYQIDLTSLEVRKKQSIPALNSYRFAPRTNQDGWLVIRNLDGTLTAYIVGEGSDLLMVQLSGSSTDATTHFVIDSTPDNGLVIVAMNDIKDPNKHYVYRYSDTGVQLWKKEITFRGRISSIAQLKEGGFQLAGLLYRVSETPGFVATDSYFVKLRDDGDLVWTKSLHAGDLNHQYDAAQIIQDASGDLFVMLSDRSTSLYLLRADTALNIKWTTLFGENSFLSFPTIADGESGIMGLYSAGRGTLGSADIYWTSIDKNGEVNWQHHTGGTGDEEPYALRYSKPEGYYIIGSTTNWDGVGIAPQNSMYVVKTNLQGETCK